MYLGDWKGVLPVDEVQVPRWLEGLPSSRPSPLPAAGILWDTRIPASNLRKRGHPHPNPHPLAGIRQRITGIRDGYPSTISTFHSSRLHLESVSLISLSLTTLSNHKSASTSHNHKSTVSIISLNKGLNVPSPSPSPSSLRHLDLDINYYQPSSSPILLGSSSTFNS
ncbi:hypothetical protein PGTUg99_028937 [Puccinia graminis f. sp. tritici]|uniref:Uncharacterized protein n=1 Tax=Puccinia graminis f. sp. tritici TaxID=56615 RepID=A0A5B0SF41_PUCGR|nr:hypothetical protein PGTUg99_028937 [Puccinia graminis f. sp. tritici]